MREEWLKKYSDDSVRTQMHYAKNDIITEEMKYIAEVEK